MAKTYVAYCDLPDNTQLIVGEADSLEELKQMANNGELLSSDLEDIKFGYYDNDEE